MKVVIVIVIIAILLVCWIVKVQRNLVGKDEKCKNSMSQIGVQQQSRWDAITNLVELVKSYNEHEYKTLKDVIAERKDITANSTAEDVNAQEEALGKVIGQIKFTAEQYPELKANENYAKAMDSVNAYENLVRTSRMVYNDSVTSYNRDVRMFPDSIIAGFLKFAPKDYIKDPGEKAEAPKINI